MLKVPVSSLPTSSSTLAGFWFLIRAVLIGIDKKCFQSLSSVKEEETEMVRGKASLREAEVTSKSVTEQDLEPGSPDSHLVISTKTQSRVHGFLSKGVQS